MPWWSPWLLFPASVPDKFEIVRKRSQWSKFMCVVFFLCLCVYTRSDSCGGTSTGYQSLDQHPTWLCDVGCLQLHTHISSKLTPSSAAATVNFTVYVVDVWYHKSYNCSQFSFFFSISERYFIFILLYLISRLGQLKFYIQWEWANIPLPELQELVSSVPKW